MPDIYRDLNYTADQVDEAIQTIGSHVANNAIHVNQSEKESWNAKADSSALSAETSAREAADTALQTAVNSKADASALTSEISARETADASINSRISAIETDQQRQETEIGAVAALGAKNLLEVTSTTQTINGVTFTVNNDQTITVNGTNTGTSTALFVINDIPLQSGIAYTLSGCPSGGSSATYYIGSLDTTNWQEFTTDTGNGGTATLNEPKTIRFRIGIRSGVTVNNLVFKPMLRRAEITDDTFVPYAPTNRELYETKATLNDVYGYGNAIQSNANLNDYTQPGAYYCPNAAVAGSLTNSPITNAGFRLVVESITNTVGRFIQTIHANGNDGCFYQRKQTSQGMSPWYKFEGTQVASAQSAASLMQAGRLDAAEQMNINDPIADSDM